MKNDNIAKNVSSSKADRSSVTDNNSDNDVDYKNNSPSNSRSKSTSNKSPSSGNIKGVQASFFYLLDPELYGLSTLLFGMFRLPSSPLILNTFYQIQNHKPAQVAIIFLIHISDFLHHFTCILLGKNIAPLKVKSVINLIQNRMDTLLTCNTKCTQKKTLENSRVLVSRRRDSNPRPLRPERSALPN